MLQQLSHGRQQTPPGSPSPDVRGGRWGKSSEGSRACLPAALWAGGTSCSVTAFAPRPPPGPQLILDGDVLGEALLLSCQKEPCPHP